MSSDSGRDISALWMQLSRGNERALSGLYDRSVDQLYRYGCVLHHDYQLVEDCIQDLFLTLWQDRKKLTEVRKVETYLMVSLRNRIYDRCRSARYKLMQYEDLGRFDHLADEFMPEEVSVQYPEATHLLEELPPRMKEAVYLRYIQGVDYAEIARIMEVGQQVAINMVYRALKKLRQGHSLQADF